MGILSALFSKSTMIPASIYGDRMLCLKLRDRSIAILNRMGYTSANELQTLENDKGFFNDIFIVFCNPMYADLKISDRRAFLLSVASTSMLGGMYAYFCAKILQKPLYGDYAEVLSRFKNYGPLPCVMRFIHLACDHNSEEELSEVIDSIIDAIDDYDDCCEGEKLRALAHVMYDTGMTMGTFFLK